MKKRLLNINWKVLIVSLVVVYGVAIVGSLFTSSSVDSDYYETIKPSITPPNWVFPVVWNVLFFLIAVALYLVWVNADKVSKSGLRREKKTNQSTSPTTPSYVSFINNIFKINMKSGRGRESSKSFKSKIIIVFGVNFVLNVLWSVLYFGMRNPFYAFIDLVLLWVSILVMIIVCYKINKVAGWLLVPYLLWVSFAGVLNWISI